MNLELNPITVNYYSEISKNNFAHSVTVILTLQNSALIIVSRRMEANSAQQNVHPFGLCNF